MTREEIERFIRDETFKMMTGDAEALTRIIDRWEEDRARVWNEAIQEGRSIGLE